MIDKWFMLQIMHAGPDRAVDTAARADRAPRFRPEERPTGSAQRVRGAGGNPPGSTTPRARGYELLADWLIRLDPVNPQTTARMCTAFETWRTIRRRPAGTDRRAARPDRRHAELSAATPGGRDGRPHPRSIPEGWTGWAGERGALARDSTRTVADGLRRRTRLHDGLWHDSTVISRVGGGARQFPSISQGAPRFGLKPEPE